MNIKEFCSLIELSPDAAEECYAFDFTKKEIEYQFEQLCNDKDLFCKKAQENPVRALALFINFALMAKDEYCKRNISQQIYSETFKDIARWENEHYSAVKKHGLTDCSWISNHVMLQLFQIESLQFEIVEKAPFELPKELSLLPALNIHIPKNADISPLAVERACKSALKFFCYNKAVFCCGSWLLSPQLDKLLNPASKIILFKNRFKIVSCNYELRQAEERIFNFLSDDPSNYSEFTALQRAAKAHLQDGGKIPFANGYFIKEND